MIVKTVQFGNWHHGSFNPMDCRGRLTMDDKGVIRYSNPDLLKPFKPVSGKLNFRREMTQKWRDRLIKVIEKSRQEHCEGCPAKVIDNLNRMIGAKCGPFTVLETDSRRVLMERREAAPGARDITTAGLHETPNLKAILDWPQEFELPVRRAQLAAPEGIRALKLILTRGRDDGPGELVMSASSEDIEYEELLPLTGCVWVGPPAVNEAPEPAPGPAPESSPESAPVIEVNLNADYVHDVCGIPLELYLQGPEDPVTWATPDDQYRYVLMPIRV